jgi:chromosome segregation protein
LAGERVRLLAEDDRHVRACVRPAIPRDPEALRAQAAALRTEHEGLVAEIASATAALAEAVTSRTDTEAAVCRGAAASLAALVRAAADRREGLARLAGQVAAKARPGSRPVRPRSAGCRPAWPRSLARSVEAEREFARLEASIAVDEEGEEGLDAAYEQATAHLTALQAEQERLREQERTAERDRQSAAARAEALELSLTRRTGPPPCSAGDGRLRDGVLGSVSSLLEVSSGHEAAIAAALGWAADAVAVDSLDAAVAGVEALRAGQNGRAGMLVGATARPGRADSRPTLPADARWAVEVTSTAPSPSDRPSTSSCMAWPWSPTPVRPGRSSPRGSPR